MASDILLIDIK